MTLRHFFFLLPLLGTLLFTSCTKEIDDDDIIVVDDNKATFSYAFEDEATIVFTADEGGKAISWDFGDGNFDRGKTVSHKYNESGNFKVKLTIEKTDGTLEGEEDVDVEISREFMIIGSKAISACTKNNVSVKEALGAQFWFRNDGTYQVGTISNFTWKLNDDETKIIVNEGTVSSNVWTIKNINMTELSFSSTAADGSVWFYVLSSQN